MGGSEANGERAFHFRLLECDQSFVSFASGSPNKYRVSQSEKTLVHELIRFARMCKSQSCSERRNISRCISTWL